MIDSVTLTDDMARAVVSLMPSAQSLLDGALGTVEPNRNHSRMELARMWMLPKSPLGNPRSR